MSVLASGPSFNHISLVVYSNRQDLGTAANQKSMSSGEALCTYGIFCSVALQLLPDLIYLAWAFFIAADV